MNNVRPNLSLTMNSNVSRNLIFPGEKRFASDIWGIGTYTKQKLQSLNQTEQRKERNFSLLTNVQGWDMKRSRFRSIK